ncbi:unnamed protein product [Xylocopa violacea]|uniref:Uncharacterized protein n=1 Tax=Xylocopa violacea TaxID=135666 RepID=A0ABP1P4T5_XYLVO
MAKTSLKELRIRGSIAYLGITPTSISVSPKKNSKHEEAKKEWPVRVDRSSLHADGYIRAKGNRSKSMDLGPSASISSARTWKSKDNRSISSFAKSNHGNIPNLYLLRRFQYSLDSTFASAFVHLERHEAVIPKSFVLATRTDRYWNRLSLRGQGNKGSRELDGRFPNHNVSSTKEVKFSRRSPPCSSVTKLLSGRRCGFIIEKSKYHRRDTRVIKTERSNEEEKRVKQHEGWNHAEKYGEFVPRGAKFPLRRRRVRRRSGRNEDAERWMNKRRSAKETVAAGNKSRGG